ncbi:MAG: hypothetical protein ACLFOY_13630 [Desulfatibacillaceae bacterium]
MKITSMLLCLALAAALSFAPSASAFEYAGANFRIGAKAIAWLPDISGDTRYDLRLIPIQHGTKLDLVEDLDVDSEMVFGGEGYVGWQDHTATLRYTFFEYTSQPVLDRDSVFYGRTFPVGAKVYHTFEWEQVDLEYLYRWLKFDLSLADTSLDLQLRAKHIEGTGRMMYQGKVSKPSFSRWVASVGGGFQMGMLGDHLRFAAHGTWMEYPENRTFEMDTKVSGNLWLFGAEIGYRWMLLDVEAGETYIDVELAGPYAALTLEF